MIAEKDQDIRKLKETLDEVSSDFANLLKSQLSKCSQLKPKIRNIVGNMSPLGTTTATKSKKSRKNLLSPVPLRRQRT
jgi:hypothetical protein